ncbi:MAG: hypothetical protein AMXMBFR46_07530, partial [Acidimicrobiia bacterium]
MIAADLWLQHADNDDVGAWLEDRSYTYREVVAEARRRAAWWEQLRDPSAPPHIGVLLDNTAEYVLWLGAAAISGAVVVGINATYRGAELARLIDHTDCQLLVTSETYAPLLADAPSSVPVGRTLHTHTDEYASALAAMDPDQDFAPPAPEDPYLLIFTSGSTGFPKAARCTQGRFARTGAHVASISPAAPGRTVYAPLPFFHSAALFSGLACALSSGAALGSRARFSASRTMPDIRRMDAVMLAYTGKVLNYILAVPPSPDDATTPLELALGNEASESDIRDFASRFACQVRDSYGSTEGVIIVRRDPSMPRGALGRADAGIAVFDPNTGRECPPAAFDERGRLLNADEAVGELVNTAPSGGFEGYYKNTEAVVSKVRDGVYWSGDLAYRDADGWFYFAGRSNEWLRVDGENFAAGPVEAIVARHPRVRSVAVYAVPDDPVGDRVMVALEVDDLAAFEIAELDAFLAAQPDLGPKWVPAFVRVSAELPKLASMKLDKSRLRREAWSGPATFWRPNRDAALRPLTDADRAQLAPLLERTPGTPAPGAPGAPPP